MPGDGPLRATLEDPTFDVFYGAPLVVVICARDTGLHPEEDCALAAQNLMLAACSLGLGTCPIGIARDWLGQPEVKRELGIPADRAPVFPIAVGHPLAEPPPVERHPPEVLVWR
jgi:nitroreductase